MGFEGETDPKLAELVDDLVPGPEWASFPNSSRLSKNAVSPGASWPARFPPSLFDVRPDLRAVAMLFRLKERNAHTIFGAIADELQKDGVELIPATPWLQPLMPGDGFLLRARTLRRPKG